jgi:hypothetical protein
MNTASQAPVIAPSRILGAAPLDWARALVSRVIGSVRDVPPLEATVSLSPGATTWVHRPLGRRVTCESGSLWLCVDGEPQDILLGPGDTHRCTLGSALSIHALTSSVVRLA